MHHPPNLLHHFAYCGICRALAPPRTIRVNAKPTFAKLPRLISPPGPSRAPTSGARLGGPRVRRGICVAVEAELVVCSVCGGRVGFVSCGVIHGLDLGTRGGCRKGRESTYRIQRLPLRPTRSADERLNTGCVSV
jgi:hypothetical protein